MKCKNVTLGKKCSIKPRGFKHTAPTISKNMLHLLEADSLVIADHCTEHEMVILKESLRDYGFYLVHRKDIKKV